MVQNVAVRKISLANYKGLMSPKDYSQILAQAKSLKGLRVLHVNTSTDGGVGEILKTLVPLLQDVGIESEWVIFDKNNKFFKVSKELHNFLQGKKGDLTTEQKDLYLSVNERLAQVLNQRQFDILLIHDPQPAAAITFIPNRISSIWRCHIDTSKTNVFVWNWFSKFLPKYDRYIFTLRKYIGKDLDYKKCRIIPPAIDPLSEKNDPLDKMASDRIVKKFGVDPAKPLVSQISRFDPWKDPWGVMDAYREAKKEISNLQLGLVGVFAPDDPEAKEVVADLRKYAKSDPDIHILSNLDGVGNLEVNGFQVASDAIIQKSTREGFGLTVSEGMWKGKPVIGGKAGGIVEQIVDGDTGFLVTTAHETAEKIVYLLKNPDAANKMGVRGKDRVRQHFLITRLLLDHLRLYDELV